MRETTTFQNSRTTVTRPAPTYSAPSTPRSSNPVSPGGNAVPNITYRYSPSNESLSRSRVEDARTPSISVPSSNSPLVRDTEPRSESSKTLSPEVTSRTGTQIFRPMTNQQDSESSLPSKSREIYSSRRQDLERRTNALNPTDSSSTPLAKPDSRVDSKGPSSTPAKPDSGSGARSRPESRPPVQSRPEVQNRPSTNDRSASTPPKVRDDSASKVWSSRSTGGSSNPSANQNRSREPNPQIRERITQRRAEAPIYGAGRVPSSEQVRRAGSEVHQSRDLDARLTRDYGSRSRGGDRADGDSIHHRWSVIYHDRPDLIGHGPRYSYIYRDRHNRVFSRMIWPGYAYPVYYGYGSNFCVRWVYPYYHRRYMFVSLGGWWPNDYSYARYYWYGWHPYVWYGYYPVPREIETSPDNYYYTYNYYYPDTTGDYSDVTSMQPSSQNTLPYGIDNDTYAKIQAIVQKQKAGDPPAATDSDNRFEAGVESFGSGQYTDATNAFAEAMRLAPEDKILPYAYSQALLAAGRYNEAAEVLRGALHQITPEQEGVFYPRGLYTNDDVLFGQIDQLLSRTESYNFDGDLQLLLGYQLMGIGEVEYARQPLERASQDTTNAEAARSLLGLLDKMGKVEQSQSAAAGQTPGSLGTVDTGSAATGAVTSRPQNEEDSAAKSNLLDKVKEMNATPATPMTVDPNAATPGPSENKDPNGLSSGTFHSQAMYGSDDESSGSDPEPVAEAALLPSGSVWAAVTDERLVAVTGISLLIGGALCLRRAGRLGSDDRVL